MNQIKDGAKVKTRTFLQQIEEIKSHWLQDFDDEYTDQ